MKTIITYLFLCGLTTGLPYYANAQNWEYQANGLIPENYGVYAISVVDELTVWAVAIDRFAVNGVPLNHITKVIKTSDGGISWESHDVEEAEGRISFDLVAFDENVAFITTQDLNNGSGRGVFKTEDGGNTWEEKFSHPAGAGLIRFFSDQEAVIANGPSIATTQDGGDSWDLVSSKHIPSYQNGETTLHSSGTNHSVAIDNYVWFGTNQGRVFRTKDKGHSWEVFNTSLGSNGLIPSIAFTDTLNGIAIKVNAPNPMLSITHDGGETWETESTSPSIPISNLSYVPGTDSTFIGTSDVVTPPGTEVSAYSTDFGKNWVVFDNNIPFGATQFISPTVGWSSRGVVDSTHQAVMYKWEGDTFVSTEEKVHDQVCHVFPNPFSNNLTIEIQVNPDLHFRLFDNSGRLINSGRLNQQSTFLNLAYLNPGLYYLQLTNRGEHVTKKLIKIN